MFVYLSAGAVVLLIIFINQRRKKFQVFRRMGVPGPAPSLLFGNIGALRDGNVFRQHTEWARQYGRLYGYYIGEVPYLVTADPDIIKEIYVKQFENFHDRSDFLLPPARSDPVRYMMLLMKGDQWKRVRTALTPTFSAAKLKHTVPIINDVINDTIEELDKLEKTGEVINMSKMMAATAFDVIFAMSVSAKSTAVRDPDHHRMMQALVRQDSKLDLMVMILGSMFAKVFPVLRDVTAWVCRTIRPDSTATSKILPSVEAALAQRLDQLDAAPRDVPRDLMSAMINITKNPRMRGGWRAALRDTGPDDVMMNAMELRGQLLMVVGGGFDTSYRTLANIVYVLATHPDIQTRLRAELRALVRPDVTALSYDVIHGSALLEAVFTETLRLYPPLASMPRECVHSTEVKGYRIPRGMGIDVPVGFIHHDPDLYPEPDAFRPDRFLGDAPATLSFGMGQRNCPGQRMAALFVKATILRLILRYDVIEDDVTRQRFHYDEVPFGTMKTNEGAFVRLRVREDAIQI